MNPFALSGIFISISSSIMAILIFAIGKQRLHYIWGILCVAVTFWGFGAYKVATTDNVSLADFWWRMAHIGIILIPVLFTHFVYEFLNIKGRFFIPIIYGVGIFFLIINFWGKLFITNMRWVFDQFYYDSPPGILYIPFTAFFFGLAVYSHIRLWRAYQISPNFKKTQISYFFLATVVGFLGGGLSFLPVYKIDAYPVSNFTVFLYPLIVTYAIIKRRLFDIRIVVTQLFVGVIAILLFINIFTSRASFEYLWKSVLFVAFLIFGYLLIKSVLNEIKFREQLQFAYQKLEELDQTKSEFISIASHQLRTPLTAIKGYLSMVIEGSYGKMPEKAGGALKNMYASNERLIKLVNDLLSISRIEAGRMEMNWGQGNVEEIAKSVMEELEIKAREKNIKLILEKSGASLPQIRLDSEKIRNVILNLIDNAIRYTNRGSIKTKLGVENNKLKVRIADTGEGMTKDELDKLFESFSRGGAGNKLGTEG